MNIFSRRFEPQPIMLPALKQGSVISQQGETTQITVIGLSDPHQFQGRCACGAVVEEKSRFCGHCGVGMYEVLVPMASY